MTCQLGFCINYVLDTTCYDQELQIRMSRIYQAHQRVLQSRSTRSTIAAYNDTGRHLLKRNGALKSYWWERRAVEVQRPADRNNKKGIHNGQKEVCGSK